MFLSRGDNMVSCSGPVSEQDRIIFHIDVNSAFLSWEAAYRIKHGETLDLRDIPAVVGGDPSTRHGIVLEIHSCKEV